MLVHVHFSFKRHATWVIGITSKLFGQTQHIPLLVGPKPAYSFFFFFVLLSFLKGVGSVEQLEQPALKCAN